MRAICAQPGVCMCDILAKCINQSPEVASVIEFTEVSYFVGNDVVKNALRRHH